MSFQPVCRADEVEPESAKLVTIDGHKIAVVRDSDGTVHAIDDTCTHEEVSLSEGDVEDCTIECWLHGSTFDLVSGEPLTPPATVPVAVYPVRQDGDDLLVDVSVQIGAN